MLNLRVQALFILAIILKVASSGLGWLVGSPWILGFAVPILVMIAYVVLGLRRREEDITDEKFADTCYYLGFIFTITSIIFSLFDLPSIGTRITDIAVRFGAAMVSTVIGLVVRVVLVSFREDSTSAIVSAETALIDAAHRFREQLMLSYERLREFDTAVDSASRGAVERVSMQVERLSRTNADKLSEFFGELNEHNRSAFAESLTKLNQTTETLSVSMNVYAEGMMKTLSRLEDRIDGFAKGVTDRLAKTTFPDDYFSTRLEIPLARLRASTGSLADSTQLTADEVLEAAEALGTSLKAIRLKANAAEKALSTMGELGIQQSALHSSAEAQVATLKSITDSMLEIRRTLTATVTEFNAAQDVSSKLLGRLDAAVVDSGQTRRMLESSLGAVANGLSSNASATESVVSRLAAHTAATEKASTRLEAAAAADAATATALARVGTDSAETLARASDAVAQLKEVSHLISQLSESMRTEQSRLTAKQLPPIVPPNIDEPVIPQFLPVAKPFETASAARRTVE